MPRGDSQSMAFRLTKKETATTAIAIRINLKSHPPPGLIQPWSLQGGVGLRQSGRRVTP